MTPSIPRVITPRTEFLRKRSWFSRVTAVFARFGGVFAVATSNSHAALGTMIVPFGGSRMCRAPNENGVNAIMGELVRLKNGAWQDPATGRIVAYHLDSETARQMAVKRWSMAREAVRKALAAHPDAATDADGLRIAAESQLVLATDPDQGSASTGAARFLWEKGGYDQPAQSGGKGIEGPTVTIEIRSEEVAKALTDRIDGAVQGPEPRTAQNKEDPELPQVIQVEGPSSG